jgi:hypothetical protein
MVEAPHDNRLDAMRRTIPTLADIKGIVTSDEGEVGIENGRNLLLAVKMETIPIDFVKSELSRTFYRLHCDNAEG